MFHDWDSFYLIVGPSAGAMIGMLFVVASLAGGLEQSQALRGASIYMTPTVFHLGVVMVLSAVASVPALHAHATGALIAAAALGGLVYCATVIVRLYRPKIAAHWSDIHCYGCVPALVYALLAATAATVWFAQPAAPYLLAATLTALLLISIRNAWDLVTWIAPMVAAKT